MQILFLNASGVISDREAKPIGRWIDRNPLGEELETENLRIYREHPVLVFRSGSLALPHHTWGLAGQQALEHWLKRLRSEFLRRDETGFSSVPTRVMIRPNHADVLSDPQRCLAFARQEQHGLLLALDPVGLLAPTMLDQAEDHLSRVRQVAEHAPLLGAIILSNVDLAQDGRAVAASLDAGRIDPRLLRPFVEVARAREIPLMIACDGPVNVPDESGLWAAIGLGREV
ncbi:MAG: hypothetical protein KF838_08550 [Phycisphaeraceae bacterium]|nr:MAG: hypothetical protein KF838_08550 [Phycisphaeraceae bacterium]